MKRTIKILTASAICFILNISFVNSVHAQDAEYNLIRRSYTVNNDGTIDIRYRKEIKLLRNRAITAYADKGETFILYNPDIDQLTINESYTIRPDGSQVQTPANAFIDQLPSQCENCGRYNNIRERVVVHTALEYNCIIVLDYTIHRKAGFFDETITLEQDCPVKKYEIIVDIKRDHCELFTHYPTSEKNIKTVNDGHDLHIVATKLPQTPLDSYLPNNTNHTVHFSNDEGGLPHPVEYEDLPEANNVIGELFREDPLEYAIAIRDYVIDYIHTNNIPPALTGYSISPANVTFSSACGTIADKKRLLSTMLHQAGFNVSESDNGVYVTINENGIDLDYFLSPSRKNRPLPEGIAIDEQRTIEINETIPWQGVPVGNGYKQMVLPRTNGSIDISPTLLTSVRNVPIKVRNCNESYNYTILLPRTPKHMLVGKPVKIKYSKKGIGSIYISIKQKDNGEIEVIRQLNIDVKDGIVTPKQYKNFRKIMQDWNQYNTITIKAQPGRPINQ